MHSLDAVFVGVDPTSGHKSFTYTALDKDLNLLVLADGEMEDVLAFLGEQSKAVIAVNAPPGVNLGLVKDKMKREMQKPHKIRGADLRLGEYELRERGIAVAGTPANVGLCPAWMQEGFELYRKLGELGFEKYPQGDDSFQVLETNPHACYCVLANEIPLSKVSMEGKLQRQLILYEKGLRIRDPMDFFEEITRYKMARGVWPVELLYLPEQLDALVAAYTAWVAVCKTENIAAIGDEREGLIILPANELREKY